VNLKAGIYELYCPVGDHEKRGMVGTLSVSERVRGLLSLFLA
jgi:uncharacterized cupredoxin-like copper-binding protein